MRNKDNESGAEGVGGTQAPDQGRATAEAQESIHDVAGAGIRAVADCVRHVLGEVVGPTLDDDDLCDVAERLREAFDRARPALAFFRDELRDYEDREYRRRHCDPIPF